MEAVSLAIGTSGLITVVEKILQLSRIVHEVKSFPSDMAELAIQLDHEKQKINLWSSHVTFHARKLEVKESQTTGGYKDALISEMKRCIEGAVNSLEKASKLASTYVPEASTDEEGRRDLDMDQTIQLPSDKADFHKALRLQLEEWIERKVTKRRMLTGVARPWDKPHLAEFREVLGNLKYWNTELFLLLGSCEREDIRYELSSRFMAEYTDDRESLQIIGNDETTQNENTAASARLSLQVLDYTDNTTGTQLHWNKKLQRALVTGKYPSLYYDWLDCNSLTDKQIEIAGIRINALCDLLNTAKPQGITTLKPFGFVYDKKKVAYGLASEVPLHAGKDYGLSRLLGTNRLYSLDDRFALARQLCHTFHQLHMSNWLHRGFNSTCVRFYTEKDGGQMKFLAVTGFQFARPADTEQISLGIAHESEASPYLHPEVRENHVSSSQSSYVRYNGKHDIFSLGVVLLEIGIWRKLTDVKLPGYGQTDLRGYASKHLPHLMGKTYAEVVDKCLAGNTVVEGGAKPALELSWLYYDIVQPMDNCQCGLRS